MSEDNVMHEAYEALGVEIARLTDDLRATDPADHARLANVVVALRATEDIQGCVALFVATPNAELVERHGDQLGWLRGRLERYVSPGEEGIARYGGADFLASQDIAIAVDMVVAHEVAHGVGYDMAPDPAVESPGAPVAPSLGD